MLRREPPIVRTIRRTEIVATSRPDAPEPRKTPSGRTLIMDVLAGMDAEVHVRRPEGLVRRMVRRLGGDEHDR